ncbi:hypothetical protein [Devosia sp. 2618]|uniref:hypothetical protein n=1 Tax=Devosia sp. 2618 TaxID=3156454 RepID=UPI00339563B6
MKRTILLTALLGIIATPALAQEAQCFQNDQFLVIGQERLDEVGTDFLIRAPAKGKIACIFEQQPGDLAIGGPDDAFWYEGLAGRYLVLTRSTGPDGDVVIYDLANGDPVTPYIEVPADDEITIDNDSVTYWARGVEGTAENCPGYADAVANGWGTVIANEVVLDIATGDVHATGQSHCSTTQ